MTKRRIDARGPGRSLLCRHLEKRPGRICQSVLPYLGYDIGDRSALNAYLLFAKNMNPEYKPIPSHQINFWNWRWRPWRRNQRCFAVWNGAGDQMDSWRWCGVVAWLTNWKDANMYIDRSITMPFVSAAFLGKDLGKPTAQPTDYTQRAETSKRISTNNFGGTVGRIYLSLAMEGNDVLCAWICIPHWSWASTTCKDVTIDALFSPRLWTETDFSASRGATLSGIAHIVYARVSLPAAQMEKAIDYL